ncbi:MAG: phosphatase PAP2 family protein [Chloroflexi bacterium]|nr:phosphatase PAP2 family protein [Chloroflexota bacterium]
MTLRAQLSAADNRFSRRVSDIADRNRTLRKAAIVLAHSGDSPLWVGGLLLALWLGSASWKFAAMVVLIGIGVTAAVVQSIKVFVRRPRPAGEWGQGYRKIDPHSFPSGHAARAALLAALAVFLGPPVWAALALVWAPLVALSRVAMRVHYLSDVLAGALCGLVCAAALGAIFSF